MRALLGTIAMAGASLLVAGNAFGADPLQLKVVQLTSINGTLRRSETATEGSATVESATLKQTVNWHLGAMINDKVAAKVASDMTVALPGSTLRSMTSIQVAGGTAWQYQLDGTEALTYATVFGCSGTGAVVMLYTSGPRTREREIAGAHYVAETSARCLNAKLPSSTAGRFLGGSEWQEQGSSAASKQYGRNRNREWATFAMWSKAKVAGLGASCVDVARVMTKGMSVSFDSELQIDSVTGSVPACSAWVSGSTLAQGERFPSKGFVQLQPCADGRVLMASYMAISVPAMAQPSTLWACQ